MFDNFPDINEFMTYEWEQIHPYYADLAVRELTEETVKQWLLDWTTLSQHVSEMYSRLYVATTLDTADDEADAAFSHFMETIYKPAAPLSNQLNRKLVESDLHVGGLEVPMRGVHAEIELFHEENVPLLVKHTDLGRAYNRIIGTQTVEWEGEELTITQLSSRVDKSDRAEREKAWRLGSSRMLEDREAINENWVKLLELRHQIAENAGLESYRDYAWKQRKRFDYTPADCDLFQNAIEQVVVPAAQRVYEHFRDQLDVETLRPWDLNVNPTRSTDIDIDPMGETPLNPFDDVSRLQEGISAVFHHVDGDLGGYFDTMEADGMLDLANRKGKAPGAYCTSYRATKRPFIFMNAVGKHSDVQTMLHEAGHAFHVFETLHLPYHQQLNTPMEFNEVASMAMELLAAPYLDADDAGFYDGEEAARARIEHLQRVLIFWPYMAVVDAFQHWVYTNINEAMDPAACDAKWSELWDRFMVGVDYNGLQADKETGWHRKQHIHRAPFYYVEYGMAQLGAVQVWANAMVDQSAAVGSYRNALSLGGTVTLPELYETAGATFAFDVPTLEQAVELIENTIYHLEEV